MTSPRVMKLYALRKSSLSESRAMTTLRVMLAALFLLFSLWAVTAIAHEIRPGYLEIREDAAGTVDIIWKQPVVGDLALAINPQLSSGWLDQEPIEIIGTETALVKHWRIYLPHVPLAEQTVTIQGLDHTLTDVLVAIKHGENEISTIIKPTHPQFILPSNLSTSHSMWHYTVLGITHILSGPDHLLYVFGLILIVAAFRPLLLTLTSFTVAHSITLALTAFKLVELSTRAVEALIAFSIVYLAVELLRQSRGESSLAITRPWVIAFPFGLLHGFGFAGALRETGLATADIPSVLFFFNIGIEIGQIAFVLAVLAIAKLLQLFYKPSLIEVRKYSAYVLGSLASYWMMSRIIY
jgi:hydrogenase/urease accessory protein HupE